MAGENQQKWQEEAYLSRNPDVSQAVAGGLIADGFTHWVTCGQFEDRAGSSLDRSESGRTRHCLDPWENIELIANGKVRPCCKFPGLSDLAGATTLEDLRAGDSFREIRQGLLTGHLHPICQTCHIRKMVPIREQVQQVYNLLGSGVPLSQPGPLWTALVDINENCNLRCVYCAVSQPGYQGNQMADDQIENVAGLLSAYPSLTSVGVNGHGETTQHPRWKDFCRALLAKDIPLTIISNLGLKFDEEDFDTLSRFRTIQVSVDTANEELLRAVRRKVSLGRILYNISTIRTCALLDGRKPPKIAFSCGVYDRSVLRLEEFAWLAVTTGIPEITFWNLVKYADVPGATAVRELAALTDIELAEAIGCFDRAVAILKRFDIKFEIAGNFIEELRPRIAHLAGRTHNRGARPQARSRIMSTTGEASFMT
jgi:hypothetical protein